MDNEEKNTGETASSEEEYMQNSHLLTEVNNNSQLFIDFLKTKYKKENPNLSYDAVEHKAIKYIMELNKRARDEMSKLPAEDHGERVLEAFHSAGIDAQYVELTDNLTDNAFMGMLHKTNLHPVLVNKQKNTFIYAHILQEMEKEQSIRLPKLDLLDKLVFQAVLSLHLSGQIAISYTQITKFLTQKDRIPNTSALLQQVKDSVDKMTLMRVEININEEAAAHGIPLPNTKIRGVMKDYLLPGKICNFILNEEEVGGVILYGAPVLYDYVIWKANGKNAQIHRSTPKLLDTPLNKNAQTLALQGYLKERIDLMQTRKNMSKVIKISTMLARLDSMRISRLGDEFTSEQKNKQQRNFKVKIIKQTKTVLEYWIKEKFIKGYDVKKGTQGEIDSFVIDTELKIIPETATKKKKK